MTTWLITFVAVFALDFIWVQFTMATANHQPYRAAFWSAWIYVAGGLSTILYINDHWLLIPAIVGAMSGTFFSIKTGG